MPYKDREKQRAYQKKWDAENYPRNGARKRDNSLEWKKRNPEKVMLATAKKRAEAMGVPFDLELEDIVIPERCPILGHKLQRSEGLPGPCSPSLDRIIPAKGYVKGNIQVISHRANWLKRDGTLEELRKIVSVLEGLEDDSI